jgi:hypothetical protein
MGIQNLFRLLDGRGDDEAMNSQTLSEESLKNGRRWQYAAVVSLGANESTGVVIDNSTDGRPVRIVAVELIPDNKISGTVDANVTIDSAGTELDAQNGRIDGDVAATLPGVTVERGGTYSGGEAAVPFETAGGEGSGAARSALEPIPTSVTRIEAGHSLRYTITEDSGNAQAVVVSITVAVPPA